MNRKYSIALTLFSLLAFTAGAQDKKEPENKTTEPAKSVMAEEIEVVRPYKPVLANAVKIRRNPDLNEAPVYKPALKYSLLDKKLELNTDIRQLQYQQLAAAPAAVLQHSFAKLGAGNLNTGFAELYFNNGRDEALQTGFYAKHLNQKGDLNKQQFSSQEFGLFGKSIGNKFSLSGEAGYKRLGTYFYGYDPVALLNGNPEKQQIGLIELSGELLNRYNPDPDSWTYALKAHAGLFSNKADGRENSVALSGSGAKSTGAFRFGANSSVDFTSVKDQAYSIGNHLFKANPFVNYKAEGFSLNLGLNFVQEFGAASRSNVLPAISAEAVLDPKFATLFAGITGDVRKSSLSEFSFELPFLNDNLAIQNAVEKSNIHAGIKGNLGTGFGFKATAYFKRVDGLPLFVNNASNPTRFDVVYDNGISKITGLDAEFDIKASDVFHFGAKLQAVNYKLASEAKAWFKPGFRLETQAEAQLNQKLRLHTSFIFNGDTYGRSASNQAQKVKSFMDLSAGADYQLNKHWGAFLQANNLLGREYQQYLYYPKLGLNMFGGFHYSF